MNIVLWSLVGGVVFEHDLGTAWQKLGRWLLLVWSLSCYGDFWIKIVTNSTKKHPKSTHQIRPSDG